MAIITTLDVIDSIKEVVNQSGFISFVAYEWGKEEYSLEDISGKGLIFIGDERSDDESEHKVCLLVEFNFGSFEDVGDISFFTPTIDGKKDKEINFFKNVNKDIYMKSILGQLKNTLEKL